MLVREIKEKFPLHYLIWNNEYQELEKILKENKVRVEVRKNHKLLIQLGVINSIMSTCFSTMSRLWIREIGHR